MVVAAFIVLVNIAVSTMVDRLVEEQAVATMDRAVVATERYEHQRQQLLTSIAQLTANSSYLRGVLVESYRNNALPTINPLKLTRSSYAPLLLIINSEAELLFDNQNAQSVGDDLSLLPGVNAALRGVNYTGYWNFEGRIYQVSVVPSKVSDTTVGAVISGYQMATPEHMKTMEQVTGVSTFFLQNDRVTRLENNALPLVHIVAQIRTQGMPALKTNSGYPVSFVNIHGNKYYLLFLPLSQPDTDIVLIHAADPAETSIGPIRNITIISSTITLGLGILVSWLLAMRISRPVKQLTDAARVFGDGNLNYRVKLDSDDEIGRLANAFNNMANDLQIQEEKAIDLAYRDTLTNLPNRRHFNEQLNRLVRLARQENRQIALLFIDLDNFKRINDSLGHSAGDELLRQLSERLAAIIRSSDYISWSVDRNAKVQISRLGGDEFTVIIDRIRDAQCVSAIVTRVRAVFNEPFDLNGHQVTMTASIGISMAPQDGVDSESLMKHADSAMYAAKQSNNAKVQFFAPEMEAKEIRLLKLESDIHRAIKQQQFSVHYQPFVDLKNNRIIGAEALVRWYHPKNGIIYPDQFIEHVEKLGVIVELGDFVLLSACKQFAAWRRAGFDLEKLSVNVSSLQLQHPKFLERFRHILQFTGLPAHCIEIEITESVLVGDAKRTIRLFRELQSMGVRIAIDDFGTGYSSLNYLKQYPINVLKIDKSFIAEIIDASPNSGLVSAIIAMAQSLRLDIVAEGVENDWHVHYLQQKQVNIVQGYFYSKPLPPQDFEQLLETPNLPKHKAVATH